MKMKQLNRPKGFRYIEDCLNKHKGRDIWVLCPGAQLDEYPDDFFDDKISITLKWAFIAFPNCTYYQYSFIQYKYMKKNYPSCLNKSIINLKGRTDPPQKGPIYMQFSSRKKGVASREYYFGLPSKILKGIPWRYSGAKSMVQGGIQAAIILGAKRVILAACFDRGIGTQYYPQRRGMDLIYPNGGISIWGDVKIKSIKLVNQANRWLAEAFKSQSIQILKHHYGEGFEDLLNPGRIDQNLEVH